MYSGARCRWRKRHPEKLGCRQWRVWRTAGWDDWWRLNEGSVDQEGRRHVWAAPGFAAHYREQLGNPRLRPCIVCAPVPASNEDWRAHHWCDRSASGGRSAMSPRSSPTAVGARGRLGCRPARCCRIPAVSAPEPRLASSWHDIARASTMSTDAYVLRINVRRCQHPLQCVLVLSRDLWTVCHARVFLCIVQSLVVPIETSVQMSSCGCGETDHTYHTLSEQV